MHSLRNVVDDDRISKLPEQIVYYILSLLPTRDATKTCVLSKTWNSAWNSFPVLNFNQREFCRSKTVGVKPSQDFFKYINKSIARRCQNTIIQKFSLLVQFDQRTATESRLELEEWLNYAVSNNIQHLVLHILTCNYILPTLVLFRAKSLKELELFGCKLTTESVIDQNIIACFSLKKLKLARVYIEEQILQSLLSNSCSTLEVSILNCHGFRSVSICSTKLKSVELHIFGEDVKKIALEAPNLRFLSLHGEFCANVLLSSYVEAFKYLKELVLHNIRVKDAFFQVIQGFGVLEKLKLIGCLVPKSIRMSSYHQLSKAAGSGTTSGLKENELLADCLGCSYSYKGSKDLFVLIKNGLYKLRSN